MKKEPRLILSFRVWSPFSEHDRITELMQVETSLRNQIGPNEKVRLRTGVGAIPVKDQSWSIKLARLFETNLPEALRTANAWLMKRTDAIEKLKAADRKIEYYVSIWPNGNWGIILDTDIIKQLNSLGISVGLDIYGER